MLLSKQNEVACVSAITLSSFIFLSFAFLGQNVHVIGDEYIYARDAQHRMLSDSMYPVWLYLQLFSLTGLFGEGFYQAARLLNAVLFTASGPIIYSIARRYAPTHWAMLIAAVSLVAPAHTLTAYFMPDAAYYLLFWVAAWWFLTKNDIRSDGYGLVAGVIAGSATLVKPHGILLLLAFLAMQVVLSLIFKRCARDSLVLILSCLAGFFAVRFGLGFALAGERAFEVFGGYREIGNQPSPTAGEAARAALNLTRLHATTITIWAGPILAALLYVATFMKGNIRPHYMPLFVFAIVFVGGMVAVSIVFTARIAVYDGLRVHSRYYDMAFPLLFICGAALAQFDDLKATWLRVPIFLAVAAITAGLAWTPFPPINPFDSPEMFGLIGGNGWALRLFGAMSAAFCIMVAYSHREALRLYLFVLIPIMSFFSGYGIHKSLQQRSHDLPADASAKASSVLLRSDIPTMSIAGEVWPVLVTRFTVNSPNYGDVMLAPNSPVDAQSIPAGANYLLVVGQHPGPDGWHDLWLGEGWRLLRRPD